MLFCLLHCRGDTINIKKEQRAQMKDSLYLQRAMLINLFSCFDQY